MKCPACGLLEDKVIDTRQSNDGISIRRRRECLNCGYRFTSYEHIEEKKLMVKKRDGRRELFNGEKLASGIQKACEKRPISLDTINNLIATIEKLAYIEAGENREISSMAIGEMVMKELGKIDKVAYIRFASVYRNFNDIEEFINEIKNLK